MENEDDNILRGMDLAERLGVTKAYISILAKELGVGSPHESDGRIKVFTEEEAQLIQDSMYTDHILSRDTLIECIIEHQPITLNKITTKLKTKYAAVLQEITKLTFEDANLCETESGGICYMGPEFFAKGLHKLK